MANADCKLTQTDVELLNGKSYSFRALPLNRRSTDLIDRIVTDGSANRFGAIVEAIGWSLSYDQTPEQVAEVVDGDAIPSAGHPSGLLDQVLAAIMGQPAGR